MKSRLVSSFLRRDVRSHTSATPRNIFLRACSSQSSPTWDYDIVIAGGGIVGAAFAAKVLSTTSKKGLKLAIVDMKGPPSLESCISRTTPDVRVYALSPQSIAFLKDIRAWQHVEACGRSQPYAHMQVWESDGPGVVRFSASEMGPHITELGQIAEDITVHAAIYQSLSEYQNQGHAVDFIFGASITDIVVPFATSSSSSSSSSSSTVRVHDAAHVTISPLTTSTPTSPTNTNASTSSSPPSTHLSSPRTVRARLVVGADGGTSAVRRLSGLGTWGWSYGQEAVVCTVRLEDTAGAGAGAGATTTTTTNNNNNNNTAWQKYLSSNQPVLPGEVPFQNSPTATSQAQPLALLPLWGGYSSVVWSCSAPQAKRLRALSSEAFLAELNYALQPSLDGGKRMGSRPSNPPSDNTTRTNPLSRLFRTLHQEVTSLSDLAINAVLFNYPPKIPPKIVEICSARLSFPLQFQQASKYHGPRVALVGDAAHSIHPQAGQGLNLGLGDAQQLAENVTQALATGQDMGSTEVLSVYGRHRYLANLTMMGLVDTIHTLFSSPTNGQQNPTSSNSMGMSGGIKNVPGFLRSMGMLGVQGLGPLKARIAQLAMGGKGKD